MFRKTMFLFVILFLQLLCFSSASAAETVINNNITISQDTVWQDTVVLDGAVISVNPGTTLTLKPGTTVAGKNGARIALYGKMVAVGDENKKVRFTEEENLNKNFSLTYSINTSVGSEIKLKNFILEEGGGNLANSSTAALSIKGRAELSDGIIRRNRTAAVRIASEDVSLKNCDIYENESIALENKTTGKLKVEDNWWGSDEEPKTTTGHGGNWLAGNFDFNPWQEKGPIPIVILPGFGGSFSLRLLNDKTDDEWWLLPVGTAAYRHFAKALVLSNYYHNKDFFWGFYDWRLPCEESAERYLEPVIAKAKKESGHFQVHLLAHSMGGLVARSYIQGDKFRDDVDRLVTAGTPHLGSSEVYSVWEGGELTGGRRPLTLYLWYLQALDRNWNRASYVRENFPSLGQMRPICDYLVEKNSNEIIFYKNQNEQNEYLEELAEDRNDLKRKVMLSLIAGSGENTLENIRVLPYAESDGKWRDGIPEPLDPPEDTIKGDGTVTVKSALGDGKLTEETAILESEHGKLLESGEKTIFNQLKVKAKFPLIFKTLHYFLLSAAGPVEVEITDQEGRIVNNTQEDVEDSRYETLENNKSNLVYADFPIDTSEQETTKLKVTFTGKGKGMFRAAFWHLTENDDLSNTEAEYPIEEGVKAAFEVIIENLPNGEPKISVQNINWSNLFNITKPKNNEIYLNWQYLNPEVSIKESSEGIRNMQVTYEMDGNAADNKIDLGELPLGLHRLKAKGSWETNSTLQSEEKEVKFIVSTSLKSLITLINRLYEEEKLTDWQTRSNLINLLAEAYQDSSNGRTTRANEKIAEARRMLNADGRNIFIDAAAKDRIIESLDYVCTNRKIAE